MKAWGLPFESLLFRFSQFATCIFVAFDQMSVLLKTSNVQGKGHFFPSVSVGLHSSNSYFHVLM